jgi:phosphate transport system substrate-binding protein
VVIHAQGTPFVAPVFQEVASLLTPKGLTLNYQLSAGSSPVALARAPAVAFLASQSATPVTPMFSVRDTSQVYLPVAFGGAAVIYNLPGVSAPIRLRGGTLASMFQGKVRNWNAHAIAIDNPGVRLPSTPITIVHRADASPSTELLTAYLSASSAGWRNGPGTGVSVSWPAGTAVSDGNGMLSLVAQSPGAIGYTDQATALQNHLVTAKLRVASGKYVGPSLPALSAVGLDPPPDNDLSLNTIASPAKGAYPIATEAYVLTYKDLCAAGLSRPEAIAVQRVLRYVVGPGQMVAKSLSFGPLPDPLRSKARQAVSRLNCGGESL